MRSRPPVADEAKIPLEAEVPSFGSWNLGIRLGKLNLLQFDVLNVKIKAQEVRRWSVLGIKRKHCPCGCSSPYSNTPGWPWTLLVSSFALVSFWRRPQTCRRLGSVAEIPLEAEYLSMFLLAATSALKLQLTVQYLLMSHSNVSAKPQIIYTASRKLSLYNYNSTHFSFVVVVAVDFQGTAS